jgi:hypothetical protein
MIYLWLWGQRVPLVAPSTDVLEERLAERLGVADDGDDRAALRAALGRELERLAALSEVPLIIPGEALADGHAFVYALHLSPFALALVDGAGGDDDEL